MSVSDKLSKTSGINQHPVGLNGGRSSADINNPKTNRLFNPPGEPTDKDSDFGVSRELSEDRNKWPER